MLTYAVNNLLMILAELAELAELADAGYLQKNWAEKNLKRFFHGQKKVNG